MGNLSVFIGIQFLLILGLVFMVIMLFKARNSYALEKRITRFSIESITDKPLSFFDNFYIKYNGLIRKISNFLEKSKLIVKYSERYDKAKRKQQSTTGEVKKILAKYVTAKGLILMMYKEFHTNKKRNHPKEKWRKNTGK